MSEPLVELDVASAHLYLSVIDLGSISKAAARHGISQPSASQRIRKLERQLGLTLFDRSATGSFPTAQGRVIAERCRSLVEAIGGVVEESRTLRDDGRQRVRVAATAAVTWAVVPHACAAVADVTPSLLPEVVVEPTATACASVRDGAADLAVVGCPYPPLALTSEIIGSMTLDVVVAPVHPWARQGTAVRAHDLATTPMLLRERGSGTRDVVEDAMVRSGHPVSAVAAVVADHHAVRAACLAGAGVGVLPRPLVAPDVAAGRLARITSDVQFLQPVRVAWVGEAPARDGARSFVAALRRHADQGSG